MDCGSLYQVFVSEDEDSIFDRIIRNRIPPSICAALAADGYSLSSNPRWYWAIFQ
jgi:hypothetical protein